ncbi:preprotein translocase subunit SecE [Gordonia jinhuaensis]|uniref:Protein translocase subunit SecE n=1 Tax=Gordonia jinhuaensis TaxID=1517702 RepID=A0A916T6Y6_9ACTN|nr:preprotein translocase subunit SecE [Gordonia jinhuaensis]GGB33949.1 protein translocase subunit SecE [Gordonia jinhuaensis]
MSDRDRAARAKGASVNGADGAQGDADADSLDAVTDDEELRPSGKRNAPRGKRSTATLERDTDTVAGVDLSEGENAEKRKKQKRVAEGDHNPFKRIWLFLTQVVDELKKVIWPTRREVIQYTLVVLIFVVVFTAFVAGLDLGFAKLVLWILG